MVATDRIAVAAKIEPSYWPSGPTVDPIQYIRWVRASLPLPNGISIGTAVSAGLTVLDNM